MLLSVEQAFVGRDGKRAPPKRLRGRLTTISNRNSAEAVVMIKPIFSSECDLETLRATFCPEHSHRTK